MDNAGNRTSKTDWQAGVTSNHSYDAIYQLTQVLQGANTTESYSYDPVGNRLSSLGASPYSYNSSNELTSTPSATYSYDNWWWNGMTGCLLVPSYEICETGKSYLPPKRIVDCIKKKYPEVKKKPCPLTDFEIQKNIESTQDMENFWKWLVRGGVALGIVGTAGALGLLGEGAAAGGQAIPFPKGAPAPRPTPEPVPIPLKPAA